MLLILVAVVGGIALLSKAADEFVEGAARLAVGLKISPIVVGAVIVGFGTSAPEMVVSGIAAVRGDDDLGVGNIIGSNLANMSLILGTAAILIPLTIRSRVLRREAPVATAAVLIFALMVRDGLSRTDGLILLVLMIAGLGFLFIGDDGDEALIHEVEEMTSDGDHSLRFEIARTVGGLVGTVAGAWVLVWGATELASRYGYDDGFVGLTLVAIATSLPELVTSVAAARQNHPDLIVGNLLGSNLFNSLGVGAVVGLLGDGHLTDSSLVGMALWFMVIVCVLAAVAMYTRGVFEKFEGTLLLGIFVGFLLATWWSQSDNVVSDALNLF